MGLSADHEFAFGTVTARSSYSFRDRSYFADFNRTGRAELPQGDILDANISFTPADSALTISIYGNNLLNDYQLDSANFQTPRHSADFLKKGRVIGAEIAVKF